MGIGYTIEARSWEIVGITTKAWDPKKLVEIY